MDDIEVAGIGFYYEDLPLGRRFRTIGRTIFETDLMNFVTVTGMLEVLFTNTEFLAQESDIKGRLVPGTLVLCFIEGLLMQATIQKTGLAFLGMDVEVHAPTFVGDTIHADCEVIESRRSESRPNRGIVRTRNRVFKQDGTLVMTYTPLRMIKAKGTD